MRPAAVLSVTASTAFTVSVTEVVAVRLSVSVAESFTGNEPAANGVPLISAVAASKLRPSGRVPLSIFHAYAPVPPVATSLSGSSYLHAHFFKRDCWCRDRYRASYCDRQLL